MKLDYFANDDFYNGLQQLFTDLNIPVSSLDDNPIAPKKILTKTFKENNPAHQLMDDVYVAGMVDDAAFKGNKSISPDEIKTDYDGIMIFGVTLSERENDLLPTRGHLAEITRAFNREFHYTPVVVIFKYNNYIAFANAERQEYKQEWREGEKTGKVTMLKDINIQYPHAAHIKILTELVIDTNKINSFKKLYRYWQSVFSIQTLNDQFYSDLQNWFYFAVQNIKLPFRPDYIEEKENIKDFLVRLLARTMFCWFVKEKGLIRKELLELYDWDGNKYPLTKDIKNPDFLQSNSYYRGILQNIFFNALNKKEKKSIKDFKWTKYISDNFDYEWFYSIPYLNGGIFDKLEEDNAKESIEDRVIKTPNFLFYGIEEEVTKGKGENKITEIQKIEHKGLNGIFKFYKFTLEENTPFEEDIALDPELLGLVFENLLAELDPNLEENTRKSIRKLTGSYYTPRKIIREMVNESLFLYLSKTIESNNPELKNIKKPLSELVYHNTLLEDNNVFYSAIVHALDKFKILDPACGSGAFPMGMLHRIVEILKLVDPENKLWISLKLKSVDSAQRNEFKKVLGKHIDDYSRKLGILRDSIYGIDIQPLAVQITKLRFFISLLIDQHSEKGITPMPNIETKIICADSLKNIQPDLFTTGAISELKEAHEKYYQPDINPSEREKIIDEIVEILDRAFPSFANEITGKKVTGQNKALLKEWFNHATITAPFFNMDFFFPELVEAGGFDCVIGNPPYGGTKISDEVRKALFIESKDPYGAFIARFLSYYNNPTPLKKGGVLAFIVSDTFMTIKSHLPLRKMMMQNYIHKMIRVHPDTFHATVNTTIIINERNTSKTLKDDHVCQMTDMTNISIHENYERFIEVLDKTKGVDFKITDPNKIISNSEYAIYYYPQKLIKTNSNLPFFVANPKLFVLMNDGNNPVNKPQIEYREIDGKRVPIRKITINGKEIQIVKLGNIADVKEGINTRDKFYYIYHINGKGNLKTADKTQIIDSNNILNFTNIEKFNGVNPQKYNNRFLIPYDKSSESDADIGWLPNYFLKTEYYFNWSEISLKRLRTLTVADRKRFYSENEQIKTEDERKICSSLPDSKLWFKKGLTYSRTGQYAPTFRLNSSTIFDSTGSCIFLNNFDNEALLSVLASKFLKFIYKNIIQHTVDFRLEDLKQGIIVLNDSYLNKLRILANKIIIKQKANTHYDYASHEQIEIDKLVYEAYGLNANDIEEVENWFIRRYPKLSAAQKENLRKLGKSDNYLLLYGLKEEEK